MPIGTANNVAFPVLTTPSIEQVNADLATLDYVSAAPGMDTVTVSLLDAAGRLATTASLSVTVLPLVTQSAGSVVIAGGTLSLDTRTLDGMRLVYRFFDTTLGTELLTQDRGERDAIVAQRPDLVYEGVAMRALGPAVADARGVASVYRFFDSVHGTHFFTASDTERDALLSSRGDLVFEAGSTLYEHVTQQAGDAAVFRFFDTTVGTHFYTADAGERAHLGTRPDLADEEVAFYAPAQ